jgi:hypothetical protein
MFCPNCGSQNATGTVYCRTCGANLSLVPQALSGQLSEERGPRKGRKRHREEGPPNVAHGIHATFMGLGFLFVALSIALFFPGGKFWWFWMLIPSFGMLGKGVAELVSAKAAMKQMQGNSSTTAGMPPRRVTGELPPEPPGYQLPPPSVTEQTTRHLDPNKDRYPQSR